MAPELIFVAQFSEYAPESFKTLTVALASKLGWSLTESTTISTVDSTEFT